MDEITALVQQIHDGPEKAVFAVSGAGTNAVAWLLGVPGASRTVLEVLVPYARLSMAGFLGHEPHCVPGERSTSVGSCRLDFRGIARDPPNADTPVELWAGEIL